MSGQTVEPTQRAPGVVGSYGGVPVSCPPGLHEVVCQLLAREAAGRTVHDVGAGFGALTNRLVDAGWVVFPYDLDGGDWQGMVPVTTADANDVPGSAFPPRFENVVSVELIEHLKAPLDYLDQMMARLDPSGIMLFSSPNCRSPVSYLHYVTKRQLFCFSRQMYWESGHISPVFDFILEEHFKRRGWRFEKYAAGSVATGSWVKDLFLSFVSKMLFAFWRKADGYALVHGEGLCLIYVLRCN